MPSVKLWIIETQPVAIWLGGSIAIICGFSLPLLALFKPCEHD